MSWIGDAWLLLLTMCVLILFSAFFSGSEAALFSVSQRNRKRLARAGLGGRIAAQLLKTPERLLSAILFWNLVINMTYFAIAAVIGSRMERELSAGRSVAVAFTVLSLLSIIFLSEMLPKSVAVLSPLRLSAFLAPPLSVAVRVVSPLLPLVTATNLAASRLIWPNFRTEPEIDLADIERAIELGTDDAALLHRERMALRSLVEMAETRVSELMQPRRKLWVCSDPADRTVLAEGLPPSGYLLVGETPEVISSAILVRSLRPSQHDDLAESTEPVLYVPWSALVSQVLDQLNAEDKPVAIVVNEFGEWVGALSIDEILRNVLAPRHDETFVDHSSIQETGPGQYCVAASVSIRSLAKRLGVPVSGEGITTVAGYIQRTNERLPRPGDQATMGPFLLTVLDPVDGALSIDVRRTEDGEEGAS